MNLTLIFLAAFLFGVLIGYLTRDVFWLNVDKEKEGYDGIAHDFLECEKNLRESREQCGRLILENAQFRLRLDGQFSEE